MATKKKETIEIPMALARLLAAEPDDLKQSQDYHDVQEIAKTALRVLMAAQ